MYIACTLTAVERLFAAALAFCSPYLHSALALLSAYATNRSTANVTHKEVRAQIEARLLALRKILTTSLECRLLLPALTELNAQTPSWPVRAYLSELIGEHLRLLKPSRGTTKWFMNNAAVVSAPLVLNLRLRGETMDESCDTK